MNLIRNTFFPLAAAGALTLAAVAQPPVSSRV